MAAETGTDSIVNLSPEEKRLFGQLFRQADYDNVSVVTGEVAVSFFEKTRLDTRVLGQVSRIGSLSISATARRPHLRGRY